MNIGGVNIETIDIITFVGILITFLTGVLNLFQNKKSLYINNITKYRVIWITTFRGHIATLRELSNLTNLYIRTKEGVNKITYRRELDKVVSLIKMYLNFNGKLDNMLISNIEYLRSIINSYLLMYYYIDSIEPLENETEIFEKFNEIIDITAERVLLQELLNIAKEHKRIDNIENCSNTTLLDLKNKVKIAYMSDCNLIKEVINDSVYIINKWEANIENLNYEIDEIVQIYLKAEWIRCKVETRMWPFNRYNEEKVREKLQKSYKNNKWRIMK